MSSDRTPEPTDPAPAEEGRGGSRRELLVRVLIGAIVAPVLMLVALTVLDDGGGDEPPGPPPGTTAEPFRVEAGEIRAPDGRRFVVKGVTIPYGTFAGGDAGGLGARNYATVARDFARLRRVGVNTVRILVRPRPGDERQAARLDRVIRLARDRGFVVELGAAFTTLPVAERFLRERARRHRTDPWIWFLPMKDPNCAPGDFVARCLDWALWQREQMRLVRVLRAEGVTAPIVVNTPDYSRDLSRIDSFPLDDENIVWGVHRYATTDVEFSAAERLDERRAWADRSLDRAVILDEVGGAGPGLGPYSPWLSGFLDFVFDWTENRNGGGAIGFVWRWSDTNSMTDADGELTEWGQAFVRRFLNESPSRL
jgi:hypothetical protein